MNAVLQTYCILKISSKMCFVHLSYQAPQLNLNVLKIPKPQKPVVHKPISHKACSMMKCGRLSHAHAKVCVASMMECKHAETVSEKC